MAERPARKPRKLHTGQVIRTERLTPHMIRLVVGGAGLDGFTAGEFTDHYVKVIFRRPGVNYPEPFDLEGIEVRHEPAGGQLRDVLRGQPDPPGPDPLGIAIR